jgi:tetratricopeptide (TPR) repeat protein
MGLNSVFFKTVMKALYIVLPLVVVIAFCGQTRAQDPKPIFDRAVAQLQANDIDGATDSFRQVIAITPDDPVANYNLGLCYYTNEQYERAIPALRIAIKNKPDFADAYLYLGNSLDNLGKSDLALAAYNKVLELEPTNPRVYEEIGVFHEKQKDWAAAAKAYQRSADLDPANFQSQRSLARAYYNAGMFAEAISAYTSAIAATPTDATNKLYLAYSYAKTRQFPLAIAMFNEVIAMRPEDAYAINGLGGAYVSQGNVVMARKQYATLLAIDKEMAAGLLAKIDAAKTRRP